MLLSLVLPQAGHCTSPFSCCFNVTTMSDSFPAVQAGIIIHGHGTPRSNHDRSPDSFTDTPAAPC